MLEPHLYAHWLDAKKVVHDQATRFLKEPCNCLGCTTDDIFGTMASTITVHETEPLKQPIGFDLKGSFRNVFLESEGNTSDIQCDPQPIPPEDWQDDYDESFAEIAPKDRPFVASLDSAFSSVSKVLTIGIALVDTLFVIGIFVLELLGFLHSKGGH